jgi:hypothetical protein
MIENGDEVEIFGNEEAIVALGNDKSVIKFLRDHGLLERATSLSKNQLSVFVGKASAAVQTASEVIANSGMYIKLTPEDAKRKKEFDFLQSKNLPKGQAYVMFGKPGQVSSWVKAEVGPGALMTNPAVVSGVAGLMAQQAWQSQLQQFHERFDDLGNKLDVLIQAKKNEQLAQLAAIVEVIQDAKIKCEANGGLVNQTLWSTIDGERKAIAVARHIAIGNLEALADDVEKYLAGKDITKLSKKAPELVEGVALNLAVLGKCLELDYEVGILELATVDYSVPQEADNHRRGIEQVLKKNRRESMVKASNAGERIKATSEIAYAQVILHYGKSTKVIDALNGVNKDLSQFRSAFDEFVEGEELGPLPWNKAIRDPKQWAAAVKDPKLITITTSAVAGVTSSAFIVKKYGPKVVKIIRTITRF